MSDLSPDRRLFLTGGAAALAAPSSSWAGPSSLRATARDLVLYALPLIEMAGTRGRAFQNGLSANRFRHVRKLTDAKTQTVTQPNNDTLYSTAWLDVSAGPVRITLPEAGQRYVSLALMDMFTNNFAVLHANAAREAIIIGPRAPDQPGAIRAPSDWVWALGRTLVSGPEDLAAAHLVQDGLAATGAAGRFPLVAPRRTAPWPEFLAGVQALLADTPPPPTDARLLTASAAAGLLQDKVFDPGRFSPDQGAQIAAGLAEALEIARQGDEAGERRGGWLYPKPNLGRFGQDYRHRAQIALSGLAALPADEALYLRALSPDGRSELDSRRPWRLRLPANALPPVDGFWSLTIYEVKPHGQAFLIDNPLQRYAIGDRTPGISGARGDIDILISPTAPAGVQQATWLPAPTSGRPFLLSFRAYRPRPAMLGGDYRLPSLQPA